MTNPAHSPVVKIVTMRGNGDCCIGALAMFLGKSYEDILSAAVKETKSRRLHHSGMYWRQIRDTAAALGVPLKLRRKFDLLTDCGILALEFETNNPHVVLLKAGLIFDPDEGEVWEPAAYCMAYEGVPKALYVDEREDR